MWHLGVRPLGNSQGLPLWFCEPRLPVRRYSPWYLYPVVYHQTYESWIQLNLFYPAEVVPSILSCYRLFLDFQLLLQSNSRIAVSQALSYLQALGQWDSQKVGSPLS